MTTRLAHAFIVGFTITQAKCTVISLAVVLAIIDVSIGVVSVAAHELVLSVVVRAL